MADWPSGLGRGGGCRSGPRRPWLRRRPVDCRDAAARRRDHPPSADGRIRLVDMTHEPADAWDELACRSPRGEALQSVAWGEVKAAAGWVARRYRIEDEIGSGGGRVHPGARPLAPRHPAHTGGDPGSGRRASAVRSGGSCTRRSDRSCCVTIRRRSAAALRGLRVIARQRHAALLVIDPCWDVLGHRRPPRCRPPGSCPPAGRSRSPPRACSCRSTRTRRPSGGSSTRTPDATSTSAARRASRWSASTTRPTPRARSARPRRRRTRCSSRRVRGAASATCCGPAAYHNPAQQRLIEAGHASLWVASHEGRELAHTLVHHSGDRAVLFEAGEADVDEPAPARRRRPAAPRFAANFLLQWTIIRWAVGSGLHDL